MQMIIKYLLQKNKKTYSNIFKRGRRNQVVLPVGGGGDENADCGGVALESSSLHPAIPVGSGFVGPDGGGYSLFSIR